MSESTKKNFVSFLVRISLSAILLWYLFAKVIDVEKTVELLKTVRIDQMMIAFAIFFFINLILLWRWLIFIRALHLSARIMDVIRYYFIGLFGNLFLPSSIGGDFLKILGLCKRSNQKPKVVASVLLDRFSGFVSIVIVAVIAFFAGYSLMQDTQLLIPILLMGSGMFCVALVLFNRRIYETCCRLFHFFFAALPKRPSTPSIATTHRAFVD